MNNGQAGVLLLIAYGNSLRRDDGAGLALAEQLAALWQQAGIAVRHLATQQLTPEIALEISAPDVTHVVFVDTRSSNINTVKLQPLVPDEPGRRLGHHLTPESLLFYAGRLYNRCPPAWLLTIPGTDFGFGEEFSEKTAIHLRQTPLIAREVYSQLGQ